MRDKQYIICSAIHFDDGKFYNHQPFNIKSGFVVCGHRHHNCFMTAFFINRDEKLLGLNEIQGFLTNDNIFVDRKDAVRIAFDAKQIDGLKERLYSEDLY